MVVTGSHLEHIVIIYLFFFHDPVLNRTRFAVLLCNERNRS